MAPVFGRFRAHRSGGSEQRTWRAVARLADPCNFVDGDIAEIRQSSQ
jgi:hypothetical protein